MASSLKRPAEAVDASRILKRPYTDVGAGVYVDDGSAPVYSEAAASYDPMGWREPPPPPPYAPGQGPEFPGFAAPGGNPYVPPPRPEQIYNPYGLAPYPDDPTLLSYGGFGVPPPPAAAAAAGAAPAIPKRKSTTTCRHWNRGFCRLGEMCGFSHSGPQGVSAGVADVKAGGAAGGASKAKAAVGCRHWGRGHCMMGSNCRFAHDFEAGSEKAKQNAQPVGGGRANGAAGIASAIPS